MIIKSLQQSRKKIFQGIIIFVSLVLLTVPISLLSCTPEQVIGRLLICSDIDDQTFEPSGIGDEYNIDSKQIFAAIKVAGIRGSDEWRFVWENADTGEVIADSTNIYSPDRSSFIEGYLSNKLMPGEDGSMIAEPGNYIVNYYHNDKLKGTAEFTIKWPEVNILETGLYRDIGEDGVPSNRSDVFFQEDIIYEAIKVAYMVEGDNYKIVLLSGEKFLIEEDLTIDKNYYKSEFIIFKLMNEDQIPFPVGTYTVRIFHNNQMMEEYYFEVIADEFTEMIFSGESIYKNDEFKFTVLYPDRWLLTEEDMEAGSKARFTPEDNVRQILINIWALKENYSPAAGEYSSFADKLLSEQTGQEDESGIEKTESERTIGDMEVYEVKYANVEESGEARSMTFSFFKKNSMLFLFMRLTDAAYIDYGEKVVDIMIDSINFTE